MPGSLSLSVMAADFWVPRLVPLALLKVKRKTETGIVVVSAAHLAHAGHDARGTLGYMLVKPLLEQRVHFPGQTQHDAERRRRAGIRRSFENAFELRLVDCCGR